MNSKFDNIGMRDNMAASNDDKFIKNIAIDLTILLSIWEPNAFLVSLQKNTNVMIKALI